MLVALVAAGAACTDDQEPAKARELYTRVTSQDFRSWKRPSHYAGRTASFTAHADAVDIYLNPILADAVAKGLPPPFPEGSLVIKEGYSGSSRKLVAIMEKRDGAWFFAEYGHDGDTLFSGQPSICTDCHDNRAAYSDWIYSVEPGR